MLSSINRVIQEINTRLNQIQKLAEEYAMMTPEVLLNRTTAVLLTKAPDEID